MRSLPNVVLLTLVTAAVSPGGSSPVGQSEKNDASSQTIDDVKHVLAAQVTAWNEGDIPGFMAGYVNSEDLRFASGGSVTRGWQATLDRYQKRYTDRTIMGTLEFKDLNVLPLSDTYAEVFGSWHLSRDEDTGNASGLFTLLMKKTSSGWRVFHDHTSSADTK